MNIKELKQAIYAKNLSDDFMVWVLTDYTSLFIVDQYIHEIASIKELTIKYIDKFSEIGETGFLKDTNLYIYKTDTYELNYAHDNCIVICNKSNNESAIKIPKLEEWQFVDYLCYKLPGMNKLDIEWLLTQYKVPDSRVPLLNLFRLNNDLDKISIFDKSVQGLVFDTLYNSGEYSTVSNLTIFDLTNALIKNDKQAALQVLKVLDYIVLGSKSVWLLSILLNSIKNILAVQLNENIKAQDLGITDKQLYVIKKYNINHYSTKKLVSIYKLLTNMEYMYKFGGVNQDMVCDYIVCKIFEGE